MKKKLAYIDHSYHKKTRSTFFVIDLLNKYFDVEVFWDHSWNSKPKLDLKNISRKKYDTVVFFQLFYPPEELRKLDTENIILIPMYDGGGQKGKVFWLQYKYFKFLNFSKTLHIKLLKFGLTTKCIQYFIPPINEHKKSLDQQNLNGFFWQRTNFLNWNHVRELIKYTDFNKIYFHSEIDPGHKFIRPSQKDINKFNISFSKWFHNKEKYYEILKEVDIYFAPRRKEGIGISFLEAMAMGKCVVAPDRPTMNEYIKHGFNGLLYDPSKPEPLDFSSVKNISDNARQYMEEGYSKWINSESDIIDFINEPMKTLKLYENSILKIRIKTVSFIYDLQSKIYQKFPFLKKVVSRIKKLLKISARD
jgi:hypothetical protein